MYLKSAERVNMVDSSYKFLLKEKDSREIEPFPFARFFFLIPNLILFLKSTYQHPMSSQCFLRLSRLWVAAYTLQFSVLVFWFFRLVIAVSCRLGVAKNRRYSLCERKTSLFDYVHDDNFCLWRDLVFDVHFWWTCRLNVCLSSNRIYEHPCQQKWFVRRNLN